MNIVNTLDMPEESFESPHGKFAGIFKGLSIALGRKPESTDLNERHPFDVEITRVPAGQKNCPLHSHSAQWEFYHVLSGSGFVRNETERKPIKSGDTFIFKPGEAHQLIGGKSEELVILVVADNPIGETCYYPESNKWLVRSPERRLIRSKRIDYFDGEE